jgi:hypothetical protein
MGHTDRRAGVVMLGLVAAVSVALGVRFVFDASPDTDAALRAFPLDDAYMHLVYARGLAEEGTLAYNPGEPQTGATSPLWAVVLAGVFAAKKLGLALPTIESVKVLGVLFSALAAWLAGLFTLRITDRFAAGLLASLLVALEPSLSFARVSGMEVPLASALVLGALWALVGGRLTLAAALLGLAPVARPELALCLGLLPLFAHRQGNAPRSWLPTATRCALALTPSAAWATYCMLVSGRPLPATFYAKHDDAGLLAHLADLPRTATSLLTDLPVLCFGLGLVPLALGARAIARSDRFGTRHASRAVALLPFVLLLGLVWAHDLLQPLAYYWYRYLLVVVPLLCAWIAIGALELFAAVGARRALAFAALACLGLPWALLTFQKLPQKASLFAWNCQNIAEAQVVIGRWLAEHVPPARTVATIDAGAVRYYSHRRTIDMLGLNHHRVLSEGIEAVFARERPWAYVTFPAVTPELVRSPGLAVVFQTFSQRYTICNCPQQHMVVLSRAAPGR